MPKGYAIAPLAGHLPLMEDFYTIQGEGAFTGQAAYFLRLAGCDVGCIWCDVKESWAGDAHPQVPIRDMVSRVVASGARIAVITGGEPLMYDLSELTQSLQQAGIRTHIETSGAHPISGSWDWICLSPKKFKAPIPDMLSLAHELKVVIYHPSDLQWAEQFAQQVADSCVLLLQPEWSREQEVLPLIIDYVKQHPSWRISLQTHKYMHVP
jgi:organic radical activating enzyme